MPHSPYRLFKQKLKQLGFILFVGLFAFHLMSERVFALTIIGFLILFIVYLAWALNRDTSKNKWGYLVSKADNDLEHRVIAKKVLGRTLLKNEVVHHINGQRDDNRLIDLCVMDRVRHEKWHAWLDWKKKKSGRYPGFSEQKQMLENEYQGILLESYQQQPQAKAEIRSQAQKRFPEIQRIKPLFEALRSERKLIAEEKNIKVYHVCDNHTLHEMALKKPVTAEELIQIKGIGYAKLSMYGERFLAIIRNFPPSSNG